MDKNRKIKSLQDLIDKLSQENDSLREVNKRLYEQIHIIQDSEKESYDTIHNTMNELNQKKNELDDLILKCKQTKRSSFI